MVETQTSDELIITKLKPDSLADQIYGPFNIRSNEWISKYTDYRITISVKLSGKYGSNMRIGTYF